jgi:hypothetical protein
MDGTMDNAIKEALVVMSEAFPGFVKKAREILNGTSGLEDIEDYRELLCADCAFYHHGEEENEECGSFLLLKALLEKDAFDLESALSELE